MSAPRPYSATFLVAAFVLSALSLRAQTGWVHYAQYEIDLGSWGEEGWEPGIYEHRDFMGLDDPAQPGSLVLPSYGLDPFGWETGEIVNPTGFAAGNWLDLGLAAANGNLLTGELAVEANFLGTMGGVVNDLSAGVEWSHTEFNATGSAQDYIFNFHVDAGGVLAATDYAWLDPSNPLEAEYQIAIRLNGVALWTSGALLRISEGGSTEELLLNGTELGRTPLDQVWYYVNEEMVGGAPEMATGYQFSGYEGSLDLGTFAAGESFTLTYEMTTRVKGPVFETGAFAAMGDPFDLGSAVNISIDTASTVIPEANLMALGGWLALCAMLFRRRR